MKSSIPVNCPWGSARSCRVAPAHFRLPIGGPMLSLLVRAPPSSPTYAPSEGSSMPRSSSLIPVNRRGAQHAPVVRPPFTFGHIVRPGFKFFPRARAGPRAAVVEDEGFVLPGMRSTLSCSSQILTTRSAAPSLRPCPNKCVRPPPRSHVAHAGSQNEVIAGRRAAC
jgi:hypothetical protein